MKKSNPSISVIVPVYNSEQYLSQCIESILAQTFTDFELLLVDDGSTDSSGMICDRYAGGDRRIHVFHKANGGVGSARNFAIDKAAGEWVAFIDSDDYIKEKYLQNLIGHTDNEVDLLVSFPEVFLKDRSWKIDWYKEGLVNQDDFSRLFSTYDMQEHTSPWAKLYRMQIIRDNGIRFINDMHFGEDAVFLYEFLLYARSVYITGKTDYCYRGEIEGSLSKRINGAESEYFGYCRIQDAVRRLVDKKHIEDAAALRKIDWIVGRYVWRVLNALYHNNVQKKERIAVMANLDLDSIGSLENGSCKDVFLKFLLKNRMFRSYDTVRRLMSTIKGR